MHSNSMENIKSVLQNNYPRCEIMYSVLFLPSHPPLLCREQECQYILNFYLGEFNSPWIFVFWKIANLRKIGEIEFTLEPSGRGFTILTDFFSLSLSLCTSLNFSTEFLKEDCRHHHTHSVYFNIKKKKKVMWVQCVIQGFPRCSAVKNPPANAGNEGSVPGLGRSPREGNDNPRQYSCLENPMDGRAWQAAVHGVTI